MILNKKGIYIVTVNNEKNRLILADVVAKCWNDPAYKRDLINTPKTVLKEAGIEGITPEVAVNILENSDTVKHVVIPGEEQVGKLGEQVADFFTKQLPLQPGIELIFIQNTCSLTHIILPAKPSGYTGKLDSSHAQVLTTTAYESVTVVLDACFVVTCNSTANQLVAVSASAPVSVTGIAVVVI